MEAPGKSDLSNQKLTPMIQQYLQIKDQYREAILFYRMGDFYEMFFEDARVAARVLEIALTSRDRDKDNAVPMCGVPHHASSTYIAKLVSNGYKVAVCEQVEDPKAAKGLVRREVVRVVTPGLVLDPESLVSDENNYLMGLYPRRGRYGLAVLDASTGEFRLTEIDDDRTLSSEGERIRPREVILPDDMQSEGSPDMLLDQWKPAMVNYRPSGDFDPRRARRLLQEHFRVHDLDGFGCAAMQEGIGAAGAVLQYAKETQGERLGHIRRLQTYQLGEHMALDDWTRRNLELFENLQDRTSRGTLIGVLDRTLTPMGGRKLKRWLSYPLLDADAIILRLEAVQAMVDAAERFDRLSKLFRGIQDLERLIGRVSMATAHGRDLVSLKESLLALPEIHDTLRNGSSLRLEEIRNRLDLLEDVTQWIQETLVETPPLALKEGGLIREGVDAQLDEYIEISREGKQYIARMEAHERRKTGIGSLKIGYNKVFGYYIEVTKTHSEAVPADYVRKQTLVNAERYINAELKSYELKVTTAEERRAALEYELFIDLREKVAGETARIQKTADLIAELDVLWSLARVSRENRYVRPQIAREPGLVIREGRHPVVERMGLSERFVPNDLQMDPTTQMMILTGPNMAGKSTFLRQVALIVLMAQAGSFVPAAEAKLGIVDRIFTRVGALDNLARGQSTFMVEMYETAQILHHATPQSLVILDEIGRGTSTFDGLSIAWAVAEHILESPALQSLTLFATHYHELTELVLSHDKVKNFHIAVKEWNDRIIFLRRVVEGGTSRSYGIQVARLAGLPTEVVRRSQEILRNLEKGELDEVGQPRLASPRRPEAGANDPRQLNLFGAGDGWLHAELRKLDIETLTPLEALNLLHQWKKRLNESKE
jgi:DNA mismatch repair protein MutS